MKIIIDLDLCQGHSVCLEECPEVFDVRDRGGEYPQVVLLQESPGESLRSSIEMAARYCPNKVIRIED